MDNGNSEYVREVRVPSNIISREPQAILELKVYVSKTNDLKNNLDLSVINKGLMDWDGEYKKIEDDDLNDFSHFMRNVDSSVIRDIHPCCLLYVNGNKVANEGQTLI